MSLSQIPQINLLKIIKPNHSFSCIPSMKHFIILQITNMSKNDQAKLYQMLSVLFLTLSKGEQVQQCVRQILTSQPLFSPLPLFKYLSHNTTLIKPQHLLQFLKENKQQVTEEQIKSIIEFEPGKKVWHYKDFLQFIYPFNSSVLRQISTLHVKKYSKLEKYEVPQSALAGFLLLLTQQISLIRKLQAQKKDSLIKISKDRLKNLLFTIKKAGQKNFNGCQNDENQITSRQLRSFMKEFVSVEDSHFLYLSRKFGIKNGSFPFQRLERLIKPYNKVSNKGVDKSIKLKQNNKLGHQKKQFSERVYKDQILLQLTNRLKVKDSSAEQSQKHKISAQKQIQKPDFQFKSFHQEQKSNTSYEYHHFPKKEGFLTNKAQQGNFSIRKYNYFVDNPKRQSQGNPPKELLIKFIKAFLPAQQRLQELKTKLAQHRLDYFKLFKVIDKNGRGVVGVEDLLHYYHQAGGRLNYTINDFQLLIQKYSQSDETWITLTQFCEILRGQQREINRTHLQLAEEHQQLVLRIMEVTLESEREILRIRKQFKKHQSKYLFTLINREQTGFINYQQLKMFLSEAGLNLSMHDLMTVLKRLDRSRNGVVVQHEFVSYFQPPQGYGSF